MVEETVRARKQRLAWDPATPAEQLVKLAADADPYVRAASAQNAPEELLRILALDRDAQVRAAVAANRETPTDVLFHLVEDRSKLVRFWLTVHRDRALLRRLAGDADEFNARTARAALVAMRPHNRLLDAAHDQLARGALRATTKKVRQDGP